MDLGETPAEPTIRHVVLHDLDGVRVPYLEAAHFVEGDHVPVADEPDLSSGVVVEEVRRARFTA